VGELRIPRTEFDGSTPGFPQRRVFLLQASAPVNRIASAMKYPEASIKPIFLTLLACGNNFQIDDEKNNIGVKQGN
jgi:hypothetical protein